MRAQYLGPVTQDDQEPLYEVDQPTFDERAAMAAIIRAHGGEVSDDAPMRVVRVHTAEDLRAEAEAVADKVERGGD